MRTPLILIVGAALWAGLPAVLADRTDLVREHFIESSETDYTLTLKATGRAASNVRAFEVVAPEPGAYTLVCFVDGHYFRSEKRTLPGTYALTVRGLSPGSHRVTIQAVDSQGRIGSATQTVVTGR